MRYRKVYDSRVPEKLAMNLYEYFGGVARYVLGVPSEQNAMGTKTRLHTLKQVLLSALDSCNPDQVSGLGCARQGMQLEAGYPWRADGGLGCHIFAQSAIPQRRLTGYWRPPNFMALTCVPRCQFLNFRL